MVGRLESTFLNLKVSEIHLRNLVMTIKNIQTILFSRIIDQSMNGVEVMAMVKNTKSHMFCEDQDNHKCVVHSLKIALV